MAYESALGLAIYGFGLIGIVTFTLSSPVIIWLGINPLAVIVALLLWSLFYVFTHKGNSVDPYDLLGLHLLDNLFIWGLIFMILAFGYF